jgi:hypothetical protein
LGASQDQPSSETAKKENSQYPFPEDIRPQVPSGVTLQPPIELTIRRGPTLQTRQLWEGTVTEVRNGGFVAILSDRTNLANPDEHAVFDYGEVSPEDRGLINLGSAFYWIIGSERTVGGQIRNVSIVQFRRAPAWTRSALSRAADRAQRVREVFRTQE